MIYRFAVRDDQVYMQVATGSVENLKPEVVMQAFCQYLGVDSERVAFLHHRLDVYAVTDDNRLASLDKVW